MSACNWCNRTGDFPPCCAVVLARVITENCYSAPPHGPAGKPGNHSGPDEMLTNAAVLEGTCRKEISIYNIKIDQYNIYILEI